jgi:hypothetical protein
MLTDLNQCQAVWQDSSLTLDNFIDRQKILRNVEKLFGYERLETFRWKVIDSFFIHKKWRRNWNKNKLASPLLSVWHTTQHWSFLFATFFKVGIKSLDEFKPDISFRFPVALTTECSDLRWAISCQKNSCQQVQGSMLWFLNIFEKKIGEKIGVFDSKQT